MLNTIIIVIKIQYTAHLKILLMILLLCQYDSILLNIFSFANIIHVPTNSSTIQGGIDLAVDGDTVIIPADSEFFRFLINNGLQPAAVEQPTE